MFCGKCGHRHDGNIKFCPVCGNNLMFNQQPIFSNNLIPNNIIVTQQVQPLNNQLPKKKSKILFITLAILIFSFLTVGAFFLLKEEKIKSQPRDFQENTRTIMIYMVGSDLESEAMIPSNDLAAINPNEVDLDNVNVLLYTGGTTKWHNFISNDENAIYELTKDGFIKIKTYPKENMGSPETFTTFLNFGYDNYITENYDLIIYDHGGAIDGAVYDDFTDDHLSLADFKMALANSPFNEDNKLELVLFRTCLNGTIEVADVFDDYADYLVASTEVTLGKAGAPVLDFINDIEATDDAIDIGQMFIDGYEERMPQLNPGLQVGQMYAVIDLSKTEYLISLLDEFIKGIDIDSNYASIVRVRSQLLQFGYTYFDEKTYDMVDLYELIEGLSPYSNVNSNELLQAIDDMVVYNWSTIGNTHGLSIYFPYNADSTYQNYFLNLYGSLDFNNAYDTFISQFSLLNLSNNSSSFTLNKLDKNESKVDGINLELKLSDEQVKDYAKSQYIIFHEEEDGYYTPIISSDDTVLGKDGILRASISNNLIKVYDAEDEDYVQLIERTVDGKKLYYSSSVLLSYLENDMEDWHLDPATVYFDITDSVKVSNIVLSGDEVTNGTVADLEDYTTIQFMNFRYDILDEKGNYKTDWGSSPTQYGLEFRTDSEYDYKLASLDDGNYYCVFMVVDIYGNEYYSKLLSIE